MQLSYPVPRSRSGKIYQYSPNAEALPRLFLLSDAPNERVIHKSHRQRVRRAPGPGETVCPYSGFIGKDEDFTHAADIKAIKRQLEWEAVADVQDHLAAMAKDFNRKQPRGGLISLRMDVKPRHRPRPFVIREDLLRNLSCDVCARSYAVYAIGLFCPDCGSPNVALHFRREVELVRTQVALADAQAKDGNPEVGYRLMGNAHEDVLTAFEATMKAIYRHLVRVHLPGCAEELIAAVRNDFQNIDRARALFGGLAIDPFASLSAENLAALGLNIQKRHVIGHNLGLGDERFAELTDQGHVGKTVDVIGTDILAFADMCGVVIRDLDALLIPGVRLGIGADG